MKNSAQKKANVTPAFALIFRDRIQIDTITKHAKQLKRDFSALIRSGYRVSKISIRETGK